MAILWRNKRKQVKFIANKNLEPYQNIPLNVQRQLEASFPRKSAEGKQQDFRWD